MASLVFFLFGLSWPKVLWLPIASSFILIILFIIIEVYIVSEPIIPVSVLKSHGVLLSCLAQLGIMVARWMILFYTPVYAIAVRGWSPASAGSILIPTNLGFALGGMLAGWLHIKRAGSFWSYVSFASRFKTVLIPNQGLHNLLLSLRMRFVSPLPNLESYNTSGFIPSYCLPEWPLHRSSAELHPGSFTTFDSSIYTFYLYFPAYHFPWLCWFFRLCYRWWSLCQGFEKWVREGVHRQWWIGREGRTSEEIARESGIGEELERY